MEFSDIQLIRNYLFFTWVVKLAIQAFWIIVFWKCLSGSYSLNLSTFDSSQIIKSVVAPPMDWLQTQRRCEHKEPLTSQGKKDIIISKMAKIIARMVIIFRAVCQYNLFQRSIIKIFTKTATTVWKSYLARCPSQHDFNLKITLYLKSGMHYQSASHARHASH